jgi:hypothetical protein
MAHYESCGITLIQWILFNILLSLNAFILSSLYSVVPALLGARCSAVFEVAGSIPNEVIEFFN